MDTAILDFIAGAAGLNPILVFLIFLVSGFFQITLPPYPGDSVLVMGGCIYGAGHADAGLVAFVGYITGTILTSAGLFLLGYKYGDKLMEIRWISRWFTKSQIESARHKVAKFGLALLVVCKFIPGINTLIILFGGIFRLNKKLALIFITAISVIHNILMFYVGTLLGGNVSAIGGFLAEYRRWAISIAAVAAVVAAIVWLIRRSRSAKKA